MTANFTRWLTRSELAMLKAENRPKEPDMTEPPTLAALCRLVRLPSRIDQHDADRIIAMIHTLTLPEGEK